MFLLLNFQSEHLKFLYSEQILTDSYFFSSFLHFVEFGIKYFYKSAVRRGNYPISFLVLFHRFYGINIGEAEKFVFLHVVQSSVFCISYKIVNESLKFVMVQLFIALVLQRLKRYEQPHEISKLIMILNMLRTFINPCLLYTSPSPRDLSTSRMPSSA